MGSSADLRLDLGCLFWLLVVAFAGRLDYRSCLRRRWFRPSHSLFLHSYTPLTFNLWWIPVQLLAWHRVAWQGVVGRTGKACSLLHIPVQLSQKEGSISGLRS